MSLLLPSPIFAYGRPSSILNGMRMTSLARLRSAEEGEEGGVWLEGGRALARVRGMREARRGKRRCVRRYERGGVPGLEGWTMIERLILGSGLGREEGGGSSGRNKGISKS